MWWMARRGCITASGGPIITSKGEPSKSQDRYLAQLVEEVRELSPAFFSVNSARNKPPNRAMQHGIDTEPQARAWLGWHLGCQIRQVGLLVHENNVLRCSPDGLLILPSGELEGCEIKCPLPETHAQYVLAPGSLLTNYRYQCQFSLVVSGLSKWWLCSYCPPQDEVILEIKPDAYTERLREELLKFIERYDAALRSALGHGVPEMIARLHPSDDYSQETA
jgi:hypothetical protein